MRLSNTLDLSRTADGSGTFGANAHSQPCRSEPCRHRKTMSVPRIVIPSRAREGTTLARRWSVVGGLILACLLLTDVAASELSGVMAIEPWIEKAPYKMPFTNRAEWLDFMSQGGTVDTEPLAAAYPEDEFKHFLGGQLAHGRESLFPLRAAPASWPARAAARRRAIPLGHLCAGRK